MRSRKPEIHESWVMTSNAILDTVKNDGRNPNESKRYILIGLLFGNIWMVNIYVNASAIPKKIKLVRRKLNSDTPNNLKIIAVAYMKGAFL